MTSPPLRWRLAEIGDTRDPDDGVCWDGDRSVGRVTRHRWSKVWEWSMYACWPGIDRSAGPNVGSAATKDEAKRAVEEAYRRALTRREEKNGEGCIQNQG